MNPLVRFSSVALLVLVMGCGGSMTVMNSTPTPAVAGNFGLTATSQVNPMNTYQIGGPLATSASGMASATFRIVTPSSCFDAITNIAFTGTVAPGGQLVLSSAPVTGQVITLNAMVSADGKTLSVGTYSINGGCATGDHGTFSGFQVPLINGTYAGSFNAAGSAMSLSLNLSQTAANPFGISGVATFANGSSCNLTTGNIIAGETGIIAGADIDAFMLDPSLTVVSSFGGLVTDSSGRTINGTLTLTSGACNATFAPVALTMQ